MKQLFNVIFAVGWIRYDDMMRRDIIVFDSLIKINVLIDYVVESQVCQMSLDCPVAVIGIPNAQLEWWNVDLLGDVLQHRLDVLVGTERCFAVVERIGFECMTAMRRRRRRGLRF